MAKNRQYINWQMVLASTLVVGVTLTYSATHTCAQNITLDGTLGSGTVKTLTGPNYQIPESLGKTVGNNLFHSFGKFNLNAKEAAIFESSNNIRNILSRVTGGTASSIDGLIRTRGRNVNFFLINPSGIIFGQNARLDVSGSFVASTANGIEFGNQGFFSATNPEPPSSLLTINPSALFFNQLQAGRIETSSSLRVPSGRSLLLVGGDITLNGSRLNASGGRIELVGIKGTGTVGLNLDGNNLGLGVPDDLVLADILLTNEARLDISDGEGNINIFADSLYLKNGTNLTTINQGEENAGNINIRATNQVFLDDSEIKTEIESDSEIEVISPVISNTGNINIETGSLYLTNDAELSTSINGQGNAGNINIRATNQISLDDSEIKSEIENEIENKLTSPVISNAGNINILTGSLYLKNDAELNSSINGQGNAGNIIIDVKDIVSLDNSEIKSEIESEVASQVSSNAGNIQMKTGSLYLTNKAQLSTSIKGQGNAGSIIITAKDLVSLDNSEIESEMESEVETQEEKEIENNAGNIIITTKSLLLTNKSEIDSDTNGIGNAGSIIIDASDFISINNSSEIESEVEENAVGDAGNISIDTDFLYLSNKASISTEIRSKGVSNNRVSQINIKAEQIKVIDAKITANTSGMSKGGSILVNANKLEVSNQGEISTTTSGNSDAGNISLIVPDNINLSGYQTGIFANTEEGSTGNGGNISIDPKTLIIRDNAKIAVDSQGSGFGGNIKLAAGFLTLDNGSILAETRSNTGGNITLNLEDLLLLRNGSQISTNAGTNKDIGTGDGGNIIINSPLIAAVKKENSNISANAFKGNAGRVNITTQGIFGIQPRSQPAELLSDITASSVFGVQGFVTINTIDVDPARGLVELPTNLVDASEQIVQSCTPRGRKTASRFTATGRGGLPLNPHEPLRGRAVISGWVNLPEKITNLIPDEITVKQPTVLATKITKQIVEAQGWIFHHNGDVILVPQSPQISSIPSTISCHL